MKTLEMATDLIWINRGISQRRLTLEEDFFIYDFDQTWASTALGFGGVGGSALTTARIYVLVPNYVKFKTPYGIITTLARPELQTIDVYEDSSYAIDGCGNALCNFITNKSCDLSVTFHSMPGENGELFRLET